MTDSYLKCALEGHFIRGSEGCGAVDTTRVDITLLVFIYLLGKLNLYYMGGKVNKCLTERNHLLKYFAILLWMLLYNWQFFNSSSSCISLELKVIVDWLEVIMSSSVACCCNCNLTHLLKCWDEWVVYGRSWHWQQHVPTASESTNVTTLPPTNSNLFMLSPRENREWGCQGLFPNLFFVWHKQGTSSKKCLNLPLTELCCWMSIYHQELAGFFEGTTAQLDVSVTHKRALPCVWKMCLFPDIMSTLKYYRPFIATRPTFCPKSCLFLVGWASVMFIRISHLPKTFPLRNKRHVLMERLHVLKRACFQRWNWAIYYLRAWNQLM